MEEINSNLIIVIILLKCVLVVVNVMIAIVMIAIVMIAIVKMIVDLDRIVIKDQEIVMNVISPDTTVINSSDVK